MKKRFYLVLLAILILLGVVFFLFRDIVFYIMVSLVLSAILSPIVDLISRIQVWKIKIPRVAGVICAFVVLAGFFSLFSSLFAPLLRQQVEYFKSIDQQETKKQLTLQLSDLETNLESIGLWSSESGTIADRLEEFFLTVVEKVSIQSLVNNLVGTTGNILISVLAISFMTFFFLLRKGLAINLILKATPNQYFEMMSTALFKIKQLLSNYLLGLLTQMTFVFVLVSFSLKILGMEYAFTVGVFAAIANLIPYVGPLLGILFALVVSLTTGQEVTNTAELWVIITKIGIVFASVQLVDNVGLQPIIFSKSVKAHPLEIFVVIFAGASLAGAVGMVLAIPAYTICRVMFQEIRKGITKYKVFIT